MDNNKLKSSWAAAFTVASVWFGTHVGAGFATGNQVVNYFVQYGWTAAIFPLLAMGILAVVMYIMMKFAKLNGFDNYKDTYRALYPKPWMEVFFEIFYIVILLAAVAAAVAGAGEVLANFFGVDYSVTANKLIFNLIIVAVLIILSIFGVKLVIAASTVLSIAILISTAVVVIAGFAADFDTISANLLAQNGLETAPYVDNAEENREIFRELKKLSVDIAAKNINNVTMSVLSMGMTGDYMVAVQEGATMVRVGTGIFGARNYAL